MSDVRFLVKGYLDEGFGRPHPVPRGEKGPRIAGWNDPTRVFSMEDFGEDDNVGTALTGDLVDIDLDCQEAVAAAKRLLLTTERIHGRPGKPSSHYWYRCEGLKSESFKDVPRPDPEHPGKFVTQMLCEIRSGSGHQTILPPSIWTDKDDRSHTEPIKWENQRDPANVDPKGLRRAVVFVATVALVVKHWPSGGRHFMLLHLAGFLSRRGVDAMEAEEMLKEITLQAEGAEWVDCAKCVSDSYSKKEGGKTTGAPTLENDLGKDVVDLLRKWYGETTETKHHDLIEEMNARHFYVTIGRKTAIGKIKASGDIEFQVEKDLYAWYANQRVKVGERVLTRGPRKGETEAEYRTKFEIWREHPKRRQYSQVVFLPPPEVAHEHDFNLWTGFAVAQAPGDCSLFLTHLRENICSGVAEHYEYLLNWCAFTVQFPGVPIEVAVTMRGKLGTGKGIFARNFGAIFGRHYVQIDKVKQLTGEFNMLLSGKVVVFADEAFFAGDKANLGTLKRHITEPTHIITPKGIDSYFEQNFMHLLMATNENWAAPADFHERRFFVLNVSDLHMQDLEYFDAITKEMANGGREAFLDLLLKRPVTHDMIRRVPKTDELRVQQERTMPHELQWWKECLTTGKLSGGVETEQVEDWPTQVSVNHLHDEYLRWCDKMRMNAHRVTLIDLARRVLEPWLGETRRKIVNGSKLRTRDIVPLAEARDKFDEAAGTKTPWERDAPEGPGGQDQGSEPGDLPF